MVGSVLALFWSSQPISSDDSSGNGGDPSDASFNTSKDGFSAASNGVRKLEFRQARRIMLDSAASSIATTDSFQIEGISEGSIALSTTADGAIAGK